MFSFHEILLSTLLLFFIYKIITSINIVESVLFLILLAINLSIFLFYLCSNFLGILYLAIYIGAVTVFFLFVVMMTDLSSIEPDIIQKRQQNINFLISTVSSIFLSNLIFNLYLSKQPWVSVFLTNNKFVRFDNVDFFYTNIEEIGLALLNEHSGPFILISLSILVALIGAIFLTSIAKQATNDYFFLSAIDLKFLNSVVFLNIFAPSSNFNLKHQDMENQLVRSFLNSVNLTSSN